MSTSSELIDKFTIHLKRKGRSKSTITAYSKDIEQLASFNTRKKIVEYTEEDIRTYMHFLKHQKGISPKSISRKLNSIRTFYKYLLNVNEVSINPAINITHPKVVSREPRVLTTMESLALREASRENIRLYTMIETLLQTGIRISELSKIKIKDLVIDKKIYKSIQIEDNSNGNKRTVAVNEKLSGVLKIFIESLGKKVTQNQPLFSTRSGKPIEVRNIRNSIDRAIAKSKLKNVCVNDLRNTFIVFQLDNGMSISKLAEIVGHKNEVTTQKYLSLLKKKYSPKGSDKIYTL